MGHAKARTHTYKIPRGTHMLVPERGGGESFRAAPAISSAALRRAAHPPTATRMACQMRVILTRDTACQAEHHRTARDDCVCSPSLCSGATVAAGGDSAFVRRVAHGARSKFGRGLHDPPAVDARRGEAQPDLRETAPRRAAIAPSPRDRTRLTCQHRPHARRTRHHSA